MSTQKSFLPLGYAYARTLLASATALTLLCTTTEDLFSSSDSSAVASTGPQWSLFALTPGHALPLVKVAAIVALLVVASGWRPRVTALVHWWITASFSSTALIVDGGDHIATSLSLLLIPAALADRRRTHWQVDHTLSYSIRGGIASTSILACRAQVMFVYLHAAIGKLAAKEWVDGTAVYYWFTDPFVGAHPWLLAAIEWLLATPLVCAITWGTIGLELVLVTGPLMPLERRRKLFVVGVAFHMSIMVIFGLASFFFSMTAALMLLLDPFNVGVGHCAKRSRLAHSIVRLWPLRAMTQFTESEN